ncbi:unnamed protein product [Ilex paraguariensis]|uniref:Response regulatory domain-containing protein n=1 Tax=Ilex paraguariensis TaxID=185542 RepID=A0ABC8RG97_9AQUA
MWKISEIVSSGEEERMDVELKKENEEKKKTNKKASSLSDMSKRESYLNLPRMLLRVLLVEADDSTRQIIAALLRKCSYTVAAVPDGLKAWETLKGGTDKIDLILTEVELPSISGYALLTLIMEHDICKNIPVIMMSCHDSISVVLKCMLKGAADFLIKPVRRNELKNLWQHVWRRQMQTAGHVPHNRTAAKREVEAVSENNASSNHSSDCLASTKKINECSEKGSDAESSCTMLYLEAEDAYMENMQGLSQINFERASSDESNIARHEACGELVEKLLMSNNETGGKSSVSGSDVASCNECYSTTGLRSGEDHTLNKNAGACLESYGDYRNIIGENDRCTDELVEPSSEAIDLISKFEYRPTDIAGCSGSVAPYLELSLRGSYPSCSKDVRTNQRHTLHHSNVSAFSRYDNRKILQPLFPTWAGNCAEPKEVASTDQLPQNYSGVYLSHNAALSSSQENMTTTVGSQSRQSKAAFPGSQLSFIPTTRERFDSLCAYHGHMFPPILHTHSVFPPVWSSKSAGQLAPLLMSDSLHSVSDINNSIQGNHTFDETINHSAGQTVQQEDINVEPAEVLTPGLIGDSGFFDGVRSNLTNGVCENICDTVDGNATPAASVSRGIISEAAVNDSHLIVQDELKRLDSLCSTQREVALLKFRLKRKDRCHEKKVCSSLYFLNWPCDIMDG